MRKHVYVQPEIIHSGHGNISRLHSVPSPGCDRHQQVMYHHLPPTRRWSSSAVQHSYVSYGHMLTSRSTGSNTFHWYYSHIAYQSSHQQEFHSISSCMAGNHSFLLCHAHLHLNKYLFRPYPGYWLSCVTHNGGQSDTCRRAAESRL